MLAALSTDARRPVLESQRPCQAALNYASVHSRAVPRSWSGTRGRATGNTLRKANLVADTRRPPASAVAWRLHTAESDSGNPAAITRSSGGCSRACLHGNGCGQLRLRHRTRRRAPRDQSGARPAETAPQSRSPPAPGSPIAVCRRAVDHRTRLDRHRDRADTETVARHRNTRCCLAVRALLTGRIATCRTNAGRTSRNCSCSRPPDPRGWQVRITYGKRDAFAIHRFRSSGARTSGDDLRPLRNSVARGLPVAFSPPHRRIRQRRVA